MAKGLPTINLHLASAQAALAIVRTLLTEKMHEDDSKQMREILVRAEDAMDAASNLLGDLRSQLNRVRDQL